MTPLAIIALSFLGSFIMVIIGCCTAAGHADSKIVGLRTNIDEKLSEAQRQSDQAYLTAQKAFNYSFESETNERFVSVRKEFNDVISRLHSDINIVGRDWEQAKIDFSARIAALEEANKPRSAKEVLQIIADSPKKRGRPKKSA